MKDMKESCSDQEIYDLCDSIKHGHRVLAALNHPPENQAVKEACQRWDVQKFARLILDGQRQKLTRILDSYMDSESSD